MKWYDVLENLPVPDQVVVGWNENNRRYDVVQFHPSFGWRFQGYEAMGVHHVRITHWLDSPVSLFPFDCSHKETEKEEEEKER